MSLKGVSEPSLSRTTCRLARSCHAFLEPGQVQDGSAFIAGGGEGGGAASGDGAGAGGALSGGLGRDGGAGAAGTCEGGEVDGELVGLAGAAGEGAPIAAFGFNWKRYSWA